MEILYQCTIFASLTLIAIIVAIFVFASSIHGGASKISAEEEENLLARRKERIEKAKQELLGGQITNADSAHFVGEIRTKIGELDNDLKNIDRSIFQARKRGKALTVRNMVVIPSLFLFISIIASGTAILTSEILAIIIWTLSLALILISLYFIFRNLVIIESFSSVMDLSTMIDRVLEAREMKSKPIADVGKDIQQEVAVVLRTLLPKESRTIEMYYGIGFNPMSLEEIAREFGVSKQTVRVRLARALRMSRHPSRSRSLRDYVDSIPVTGEKTGEQRFIKGIFGL